jgi:hypothetical protein
VREAAVVQPGDTGANDAESAKGDLIFPLMLTGYKRGRHRKYTDVRN